MENNEYKDLGLLESQYFCPKCEKTPTYALKRLIIDKEEIILYNKTESFYRYMLYCPNPECLIKWETHLKHPIDIYKNEAFEEYIMYEYLGCCYENQTKCPKCNGKSNRVFVDWIVPYKKNLGYVQYELVCNICHLTWTTTASGNYINDLNISITSFNSDQTKFLKFI